MQIVIDIPEEVYERFGYEYSEENSISKCTNDIILDAFCTGTPLPKGHDKLIDVKDLLEEICLEDTKENRKLNLGEIITLEDIDRIEPIIEADRE